MDRRERGVESSRDAIWRNKTQICCSPSAFGDYAIRARDSGGVLPEHRSGPPVSLPLCLPAFPLSFDVSRQLRDLLVAPPDSVATLYENEITRHSFDSPPSALQLPFSPTSLTSNFGLLAFGSQTGDIALSALPSHSHAPSVAHPATEVPKFTLSW